MGGIGIFFGCTGAIGATGATGGTGGGGGNLGTGFTGGIGVVGSSTATESSLLDQSLNPSLDLHKVLHRSSHVLVALLHALGMPGQLAVDLA